MDLSLRAHWQGLLPFHWLRFAPTSYLFFPEIATINWLVMNLFL